MNTGYVKLHRKVMNSFVWTNPYMYKLWSLCLMKASHENRKILFNGKEIQVNSGSVWRWLKQFEKNGMLNIKSTTKYSVISIKNWSLYQSSEQQMNIKRTTSEQQVHTNKNEKNYKNEKNNKTSSSQPRKKRVYDTDSVYYILAEELFKQICQNQEIKKPNLQSWADNIRKMIEIDKRTENQVRGMIEWSQHNVFWASNILSAKKLREKYDTMAAQANRDYKTKQTKTLEYEKFSTDELPI
ncbi:replication protein [Enterococcus faecium]|nr:replication protein [Enterococcus faecium]MBH1039854.1 replication protein [Enterococcus faecium]